MANGPSQKYSKILFPPNDLLVLGIITIISKRLPIVRKCVMSHYCGFNTFNAGYYPQHVMHSCDASFYSAYSHYKVSFNIYYVNNMLLLTIDIICFISNTRKYLLCGPRI